MSLKTDYKDEIVSGENRTYDIVDSNGRVLYSNVHFVPTYSTVQQGDNFGAKDVNDTNTEVNRLSNRIKYGTQEPSGGVDGDIYIQIEG